MHSHSEIILEELISFFETDKHSEAYHIDQLTTGYYYCRNSTQTKGDPFSLQQHPLMFTVLLERFSFNREIFIWAPGEQANNPKVLVSGQLLNTRSSIFDILCLTLRQVFDKMCHQNLMSESLLENLFLVLT